MATQAKGIQSRLICDTEDTFKTTPASADAWLLPFVSETLRLSRNLIDSKSIRNTRNPSMPVRGNKDVAGDINLELEPGLGRIFKALLGTVTTTGASSPYTHTFKVGTLPSLVIEKQFTDLDTPLYFLYNGCKINSGKLSLKSEGMVDFSISVIGAGETYTTTSFDASATDNGWSPFDGFSATLKEGGTTISTVSEVDMTIENNLDGSVYVLDGTGTRYSLPEGMVKVSGTIKALFLDASLYAKAINHTESALIITFTKGNGGGTTGNEKLVITVPELIYQPQAPVIPGPAGLLVELPFIGYYNDDSAASSITMVLSSPMSSLQ
jgi:hypothetical protein